MKYGNSELDYFKQRNPQVSRYIKKKRTFFFLKLSALWGVIALVGYGLRSRTEIMITFCIGGALILPCFILKPQNYFGIGFTGRIINTEYSQHSIAQNLPARMMYSDIKKVTFINYTVEDNNKQIRFFKTKNSYSRVYAVGDTVLKVPGISYPVNLTPHDFVVCPVCGSILRSENDHCVGCGTETVVTSYFKEN